MIGRKRCKKVPNLTGKRPLRSALACKTPHHDPDTWRCGTSLASCSRSACPKVRVSVRTSPSRTSTVFTPANLSSAIVEAEQRCKFCPGWRLTSLTLLTHSGRCCSSLQPAPTAPTTALTPRQLPKRRAIQCEKSQAKHVACNSMGPHYLLSLRQ